MTGQRDDDPSKLELLVGQGDRAALAQAITLIESTRSDHRARAEQLLAAIMPRTGQSLRLAISGIPGSGKSTLIERLGTDLIKAGHRVAVLAIDPSSVKSGGSILGDKTRMANLAADPRAFIRPSPTSGTLGGVARRTREAMLLCEAAGYDIIIIETVGVGQSEVTAAELVDLFVLVGLAGAGDELQGIKRGILELADIVAINKADGDNRLAAERAAAGLRSSLHILTNPRQGTAQDGTHDPAPLPPEVMAVSSLSGEGFAALEATLLTRAQAMKDSGAREARRRQQRMAWLREEMDTLAIELVQSHPQFLAAAALAREAVDSGRTAPSQAAREAVRSCLKP